MEGDGRIALLTGHDKVAAHEFYGKHGLVKSDMPAFRKKPA